MVLHESNLIFVSVAVLCGGGVREATNGKSVAEVGAIKCHSIIVRGKRAGLPLPFGCM